MPSILSQEQVVQFHQDGLVIVRGLFDPEETALLRRAMEEDPQVRDHILDRLDANGAATRISLWNRAGDSVYGLAARCERVVDTMAALLGGPVYHFQSKLTAKEPLVGGAWEWHQDYGYWYHNGCLFPHLASIMLALDRTTRDNGCLQLVRGSNRLGRIDHVPIEGSKDQVVADPARMAHLTKSLDIVYAELEPGDAVIFHCNTLHQSAQNRSPNRRWTFLACYNRVDNDTVIRDHGRYYVPLETVPDGAIKAAGLKFASGAEDFTSKPFVPKVRESA
ncbi:MAG: phytanoyl-CoA dioxygenase family protein [Proteobacteria bacterium]|nr:phytanoyl-CoA dioxygenase family protein [Pseudomonadota bacterium]